MRSVRFWFVVFFSGVSIIVGVYEVCFHLLLDEFKQALMDSLDFILTLSRIWIW